MDLNFEWRNAFKNKILGFKASSRQCSHALSLLRAFLVYVGDSTLQVFVAPSHRNTFQENIHKASKSKRGSSPKFLSFAEFLPHLPFVGPNPINGEWEVCDWSEGQEF